MKKWGSNGQNSNGAFTVSGRCFGLFIDINDTLYCSVHDLHMIEKISLKGNSNTPKTIAGIHNSPGSALNTLRLPRGICIHVDFSLYVADWGNHRIQLFQFNQSDGIMVAGNKRFGDKNLNGPTAVVLDVDANLFIVDHNNNRIVRSGPNGFRCLIGCLDQSASAASPLHHPWSLAFDSFGNIFVTDRSNNRIQKFLLASNSCSKYHNMLL